MKLDVEPKSDDELLIERVTKMIEWVKEKKHSMKTEHYTFLKDIKKGLKSYSLENKSTVTALENYLKEYGYSDN